MKTLTLSFAIAAAALGGPALASDRTAHVAYGDLNLATSDGQAKLQQRLDKAARSVCRYEDNGQIATAEQENRCYRATRKSVGVRFAQAVAEGRRAG